MTNEVIENINTLFILLSQHIDRLAHTIDKFEAAEVKSFSLNHGLLKKKLEQIKRTPIQVKKICDIIREKRYGEWDNRNFGDTKKLAFVDGYNAAFGDLMKMLWQLSD